MSGKRPLKLVLKHVPIFAKPQTRLEELQNIDIEATIIRNTWETYWEEVDRKLADHLRKVMKLDD